MRANAEAGSETNLQLLYDFDPSLNNASDHLQFARYLKDKVLSIDLWSGDSLMHYGTCKVPLVSLLRQGEPQKVVAQEFDICEADLGQYVGGLQLLMMN